MKSLNAKGVGKSPEYAAAVQQIAAPLFSEELAALGVGKEA